MKPFTATALVEAKRVQGFESVYCEGGRWTTGSRTIFDIGHHGSLTLPEVLTVSSNIGIVKFSPPDEWRNIPPYSGGPGFRS